MPDVVTFGETMVLMTPQEPGPLKYITEFKKKIGGAESNVAIGLSRLGHDVGWFSKLGDDPHGSYIESFVRGEGVDTSRVMTDPDAPTAIYFKERHQVRETAVYYYRHGSAASRLSPADLPAEYIADAEYLHLTGITPALSETCRDTVFEAVDIAAENDVSISFDPNLRLKLWDDETELKQVMERLFGSANVVLPGIEEGEIVFGTDDPEAIAAEIRDLGADIVVVKLGAEGALVVDDHTTQRVAAIDVERVVDEIGAGDGFAAGFISGQLQGLDATASAELATAVGAFVTTVTGDVEGLPTTDELEVFLGEREAIKR